ncbi:hypothetical protein BTJ40_18735 [Microbulbifer sp. A4B17]|uniref:hypothetical protein n=1 Tax=Microbulbifer sp. A4B17 TaxID=359370 RepID=UPI000D52AB66|nr:hypothetical protein [Microbulbifer sp. A4B17]AWF82681.1 hypothetical protein BTJ40_18735 [Microbulbifer sp. A4B17]
MQKSQLYFGVVVGLLVLCAGLSINLAGINGVPLMAVGLATILANVAYWLMGQSPKQLRIPAKRSRQRREQR